MTLYSLGWGGTWKFWDETYHNLPVNTSFSSSGHFHVFKNAILWLKMPVEKTAAWCVGFVFCLSFGVTDFILTIIYMSIDARTDRYIYLTCRFVFVQGKVILALLQQQEMVFMRTKCNRMEPFSEIVRQCQEPPAQFIQIIAGCSTYSATSTFSWVWDFTSICFGIKNATHSYALSGCPAFLSSQILSQVYVCR
jgi:hypothetical protein